MKHEELFSHRNKYCNCYMTHEETIIKYFAYNQLTEFGSLARSNEYKGYWLKDDECPLYTYKILFEALNIPIAELKKVMIEMRNRGLVELVQAVDRDGGINGSAWSITEKGMIYAVDNFNDQSEETKTFIGGLLGN